MAAPTGHDRSRRPSEEEEEDDPVETMLKKTGCAELHYAVQECMAETKDWRLCQDKVKAFRKCIENSMLNQVPKS
ncbi:cytochrome c oxidase assembly factor 4 homolog, mitochondrial-like [Haliotis rubra]|uniref:cytochrome c oxidase assembly factor 4 homolog, mitochondrial-like n=1 Tax=Haliotis rubra TaxID=36100 RepID=UPI001EE58230|nr:cytochrome c oxidase assembly factor 4 homolog, mitochondrial-like [Haliotis rubra]XP_046571919.1 cytochrome c oxidase assembly factor 4 homolog, mitochondrial-like [Haliotis rubra]